MIFNSLQFNGIDSMDFGVYISAESVFNAPERDVEMVEVPGRNGDLILDNGRFKNIEVTYPAGLAHKTDFAKRLRAFRNAMVSVKGYQKIVDTYNPEEYRMGVYKSGLEVEPSSQVKAGEFEIVFDCKPQRFLMSGDSSIEVHDGDTIYNPTPFDASPLIMTEGYGTLTVNDHEIEIQNAMLGDVILTELGQGERVRFNKELINEGDIITTDKAECEWWSNSNITSIDIVTPPTLGVCSYGYDSSTHKWYFRQKYYSFSFPADPDNDVWDSCTIRLTLSGGTTVDVDFDAIFGCDLEDGELIYHFQVQDGTYFEKGTVTHGVARADSTVSTLGNPTYIDCDLGEVYKIENGSFISLNRLTDLGSDLPVLSSGNNLIEMDNTFTDVKIIPRWWIL